MSDGLAATHPGDKLHRIAPPPAVRMALERGPPVDANPDMLPSLAPDAPPRFEAQK